METELTIRFPDGLTDAEMVRRMNETWVVLQTGGHGAFLLRHDGPSRLNKLANDDLIRNWTSGPDMSQYASILWK